MRMRRSRLRDALCCLGLVATLVAAAGCGSSDAGDAAGKTVLTWWDYFGYSPASDSAVKLMISRYELSHPNVTIQRTTIGFADFRTKLLQAAATGTYPDIAAIDNADVSAFAKQGVLADLSDRMKSWQPLTTYFDAVVQSVKVGGQFYGVPFRNNTTALWYDKDLFTQVGIAGPPTTWDQLRDDAKKLTTDKHAGFCFAAAPTEEGTFTFLPFLWQAGGDIDTIDQHPTVDALNFVNTLVNVDKSAPKSVLQWGQSDVGEQFGSGLCAMMVDGPWVLGSVQNAKFAWDVAPWPAGPKGTAAPLGGEVWTIGKNTEHADAAWDVVSWMSDPANNPKEINESLGNIPNRKNTVDDPAANWNPIVRTFAEQMATAHPRGIYGDKYTQISQAIWTMEQQVLAGTENAADATAEGGRQIKALVSG